MHTKDLYLNTKSGYPLNQSFTLGWSFQIQCPIVMLLSLLFFNFFFAF